MPFSEHLVPGRVNSNHWWKKHRPLVCCPRPQPPKWARLHTVCMLACFYSSTSRTSRIIVVSLWLLAAREWSSCVVGSMPNSTHECILLRHEWCIQVQLSHAISIPGKRHAAIIVAYAATSVGGRIDVPDPSSSTQVWSGFWPYLHQFSLP